MTAEKLKPCLFCGNQMKTNLPMLVKGQSMSAYGEGFYVECPQCRAKGPLERDGIHAVSAWNLSADPRIAEMEAQVLKMEPLVASGNDAHCRVEKLEGLLREYEALYPEAGQLIAAIKIEWEPCNCWSEWDASVLKRLSELQGKITAALGGNNKN